MGSKIYSIALTFHPSTVLFSPHINGILYLIKHLLVLWLVPYDAGSPETVLRNIDIPCFHTDSCTTGNRIMEQKLNCLIAKAKKKKRLFHFSYFYEADIDTSVCFVWIEGSRLEKCDHFHCIMTITKLMSTSLETGVHSFRPYNTVGCREYSRIYHLNFHIQLDTYLFKGKINASLCSKVLDPE